MDVDRVREMQSRVWESEGNKWESDYFERKGGNGRSGLSRWSEREIDVKEWEGREEKG